MRVGWSDSGSEAGLEESGVEIQRELVKSIVMR